MQKQTKKFILNSVLVLSIAIAFLSLLNDFRNTTNYPGVDFRNRVVGARVFDKGLDPYFFKWQPGMSERLLDMSSSPSSTVSRLTITPPMLILHTSMSPLSYLSQRIIWLLVQWTCLLSIIWIFYSLTSSTNKKKLVLIFGFIFTSTYWWIFHVERGQIYICYTFLFALSYWLYKKRYKNSQLLSGFVFGLTIALRPTFILSIFPLMLYKKWKMLLGVLFCFLLLINITVFKGADFNLWQSYTKAMHQHDLIQIGELPLAQYEFFVIRNESKTKAVIENFIGIEVENFSMLSTNSSFRTALGYFLDFRLTSMQMKFIFAIFILLYVGYLAKIKFKNNKKSLLRSNEIKSELLFLSIGTMIALSDFFLPAERTSYYNVQWLIPLFLLLYINKDAKFFFSSIFNLVILCLVYLVFAIVELQGVELFWFEILTAVFFVYWTFYFVRKIERKNT